MSLKHLLKNLKKFEKHGQKTETKKKLSEDEMAQRLANTQKALIKYGPKIWKSGSKLLETKCRKVGFFGYHVKKAITEMMEALQFYEALGIAANQVGHNLRIIIVRISTSEHPTLTTKSAVTALAQNIECVLSIVRVATMSGRLKKIRMLI